MFTGLVECTGSVVMMRRAGSLAVLKVRSPLGPLEKGESVCVNGVCQTVTGCAGDTFTCDIMPETLRATNLGDLRPGATVNLERALRPQDRLGGHIVNGHIDGTGVVRSVSMNPAAIEISVDPGIGRYMVPKGSVAVDGVSLTVGPEPRKDGFRVYIIPHTWKKTNLNRLKPGCRVNIEVDILAKYADKFMKG